MAILAFLILAATPQKTTAELITVKVEAPDLQPWADKATQELISWYPKIANLLGNKSRVPLRPITVTIINHGDGVAWTEGDKITVNGDFIRKHPDDVGLVVHEEAHVIQAYNSPNNPGWLVEGVADYVRWFFYEPKDKRPVVDPKKAKYEQGYRVAASFIYWATNKYDKGLVKTFDLAMKQDKYSEDIWQKRTGHTLQELWSEYLTTLVKN